MNYAPRNRVWSIAALSTPCVSVRDICAHLRVTETSEISVIEGMALAAQGIVERRTQRLLTRRTVTLRLPSLPPGVVPVELPGGEVGSITSVTADDLSVSGVTFFGDSPAVLLPGAEWPVVTGKGYPVVVIYEAGFAICPPDLKAAIKILAAELFERRANSEEGPINEVPLSASVLIEPWRIRPI